MQIGQNLTKLCLSPIQNYFINTFDMSPKNTGEANLDANKVNSSSFIHPERILKALPKAIQPHVRKFTDALGTQYSFTETAKKLYLDFLPLAILPALALSISTSIYSKVTQTGIDLKVGNAGTGSEDFSNLLIENPLAMFQAAVIKAPIGEEVIFRMLPYGAFQIGAFVLSEAKSHTKYADSNFEKLYNASYWAMNITSSLIFAYAHNLTQAENGELIFQTNYLPYPQFILGLAFMHMLHKKGALHNIFAHSINNTLAFTIMYASLLLSQ